MIRLLVILIVAGVIATCAALLADAEGGLDFVVGSYAIHTNVGVAIGLMFFAMLALFLAIRFAYALLAAPGMFRDWARARRGRRGFQALSRGLVAAAAGDAQEARRFARRGEKLLGPAPLGLLLTAQAAQLAGDETRQLDAYRAMLSHPETEFLALRGLFLQAMKKGAEDEAIKHASRAHELRPRTAWASHALFDLHVSRHEWEDAQSILKKQVRARLVGGDVARRRRAVLLAAAALDAEKSGDSQSALNRALEAATLAPALIPAAALAARKLTQEGRTWKAQDVIEAAWAQAPHPDLAAAYGTIHPTDDAEMRARRMQALIQLNPDHIESRLLAAETAIAQRKWFDARAALEPLTLGFPTARASVLMAEIAQSERGDSTAAQGWLARAARSPRDAQWRCARCGFVVQDWTPICSNCDAFDSLSWVAPRIGTLEAPAPVQTAAEAGPAPQPASPPSLLARSREERPALPERPPDDPGIDPHAEPEEEAEYESEGASEESPEEPLRRRSP